MKKTLNDYLIEQQSCNNPATLKIKIKLKLNFAKIINVDLVE